MVSENAGRLWTALTLFKPCLFKDIRENAPQYWGIPHAPNTRVTSEGDNVLQLNTMLWYAWCSLCKQTAQLEMNSTTRAMRARRKRKEKDVLYRAGLRSKKTDDIDCTCPFCPHRKFNRSNFIGHL